MCSCYFIKHSTFNWSNFPSLANSHSCFVIYSWCWRAALRDRCLPNIVLWFLQRLLLGNGELLSSYFFRGLESAAVLCILICSSSFSSVVGFYFTVKAKIMGVSKKMISMISIAMVQHKIMIFTLKMSSVKDLEVLQHYFIVKRTLQFDAVSHQALRLNP